MFFLLDENEQVAVDAAVRSGIALAGDGQLHAAHDAGRDRDGDDLLVANDTLTATFRAFVLNDRTFAAAGVALRLNLHHSEDAALLADRPSGTFTGRTGLRAAVGRARTVTVLTLHELAHFDLLLTACSDLFKGQMHLDAHVGASAHTRPAAATSATHEHLADIADVEACALEYIAEMREDIFHGHTTAAESACSAHAGKAVLVITRTFLRVGKNFIRLCCLLEFLLGFFVAGVLVRVVLYRFLAVRFLYLFRGRVLRNLQDLIIITFFCHKPILLLLLWRSG